VSIQFTDFSQVSCRATESLVMVLRAANITSRSLELARAGIDARGGGFAEFRRNHGEVSETCIRPANSIYCFCRDLKEFFLPSRISSYWRGGEGMSATTNRSRAVSLPHIADYISTLDSPGGKDALTDERRR
jgi:hypothetical protein